jgi:hypothetical protein
LTTVDGRASNEGIGPQQTGVGRAGVERVDRVAVWADVESVADVLERFDQRVGHGVHRLDGARRQGGEPEHAVAPHDRTSIPEEVGVPDPVDDLERMRVDDGDIGLGAVDDIDPFAVRSDVTGARAELPHSDGRDDAVLRQIDDRHCVGGTAGRE